RPCPVQQREDLAQRHLPRRQRQASAALCARVELPLQSPPTHRRSDRFPTPPSRHPANHHLPPACTRRSNQRSPTCSNRIGKKLIVKRPTCCRPPRLTLAPKMTESFL